MPFKLGPLELVLILVIVMVVIGVGKLPQIGAALGKSIRSFKEGQTDEEAEETRKPRRKQVRKVSRKASSSTAKASSSTPVTEKAAAPEVIGSPSNN